MNLHDSLRRVASVNSRAALEAAGATYDEATAVIMQQREARNLAFKEARAAAKAILSQLCESVDVPMNERAAWSAAFHGDGWNTEATLGYFVRRAESYAARLTEIDAQLKEPGVPIVGFITGSAGDTRDDPRAMRYAYRIGDSSGLDYTQHYNDGQNWHYHYATAGEQPLSGRSNVLDDNKRRNDPLISFISPDVLVEAVTAPDKAAEMLQWTTNKQTRVLVIGSQAVNAMFEAAGSTPRSDLLLGHAVHLGFRPEA